MTESELEILRVKLQIEAIRVLLRGLYTGLANSSPNAAQSLLDRFAALRRSHGKITVPGTPPGLFDLVAGEYQEALDDLLKYIEDGIIRG